MKRKADAVTAVILCVLTFFFVVSPPVQIPVQTPVHAAGAETGSIAAEAAVQSEPVIQNKTQAEIISLPASNVPETSAINNAVSSSCAAEQKSRTDTERQAKVDLNGNEFDLLSMTGAIGAFSNVKTKAQLKYVLFSYLEFGLLKTLDRIAGIIPDPQTIQNISDYQSENFYPGSSSFLSVPAQGAHWSLGYAQASLIPDDIFTKDYYLAGYLMQNFPGNTVETVLDDIKVRTIILDDNSGRGKTSFSVIESIGVCNADIRAIRAALAVYAAANNIVSINVCATHTHSSIDTQGLWNPLILKTINNLGVSLSGEGNMIPGPDEEFMKIVRKRTADSIMKACESMEAGTLYFAEKDASKYSFDKRDPSSYLGTLTRLRFVPDNKNNKETLIVNMSAHPYITGLKTDISSGKELSADYTAYMDEIISEAGYNFMFFNGAICGIYADRGQSGDGVPTTRRSQEATRYGHELGRFVLAMTLTKEQILADELLANTEQVQADMLVSEGGYSLWYEGWNPVEETAVAPMLNIRLKEVVLTIDNPVIIAIGKLGLANNAILKNGSGQYMTVTEVGYLELGNDVKTVMMPGELSPDLVTGEASSTAEGSFSLQDFPYPSLNEIAGTELTVFGLANDAVGYILPDTDYCMIFFDNIEPFGDHYQETISFGRTLGSSLVTAFADILDEVK